MDETKLLFEVTVRNKRNDLNKITKYLISQTYSENASCESRGWERLKGLDFLEFLQEVGMFREYKQLDDYTEDERFDAKATRYYNAVSVSIQGSAMFFMKQKVKDIFINGYNKK